MARAGRAKSVSLSSRQAQSEVEREEQAWRSEEKAKQLLASRPAKVEKDTTLVLRSKAVETVTTGCTKLIKRMCDSAMSFGTFSTAWWSSALVLRRRVI